MEAAADVLLQFPPAYRIHSEQKQGNLDRRSSVLFQFIFRLT